MFSQRMHGIYKEYPAKKYYSVFLDKSIQIAGGNLIDNEDAKCFFNLDFKKKKSRYLRTVSLKGSLTYMKRLNIIKTDVDSAFLLLNLLKQEHPILEFEAVYGELSDQTFLKIFDN